MKIGNKTYDIAIDKRDTECTTTTNGVAYKHIDNVKRESVLKEIEARFGAKKYTPVIFVPGEENSTSNTQVVSGNSSYYTRSTIDPNQYGKVMYTSTGSDLINRARVKTSEDMYSSIQEFSNVLTNNALKELETKKKTSDANDPTQVNSTADLLSIWNYNPLTLMEAATPGRSLIDGLKSLYHIVTDTAEEREEKKNAILDKVNKTTDYVNNKIIAPMLDLDVGTSIKNSLISLGETADYVTGTAAVKAAAYAFNEASMDTAGDSSPAALRNRFTELFARNLDDAYNWDTNTGRKNFDYNTGSGVLNLTMEVFSDPTTWVSLGLKAATKGVTKEVSESVTKDVFKNITEQFGDDVLTNVSEDVMQKTSKMISKSLKGSTITADTIEEVSMQLTAGVLKNHAAGEIITNGITAAAKQMPNVTGDLLQRFVKGKMTRVIQTSIANGLRVEALASQIQRLNKLTKVSSAFETLDSALFHTSAIGVPFAIPTQANRFLKQISSGTVDLATLLKTAGGKVEVGISYALNRLSQAVTKGSKAVTMQQYKEACAEISGIVKALAKETDVDADKVSEVLQAQAMRSLQITHNSQIQTIIRQTKNDPLWIIKNLDDWARKTDPQYTCFRDYLDDIANAPVMSENLRSQIDNVRKLSEDIYGTAADSVMNKIRGYMKDLRRNKGMYSDKILDDVAELCANLSVNPVFKNNEQLQSAIAGLLDSLRKGIVKQDLMGHFKNVETSIKAVQGNLSAKNLNDVNSSISFEINEFAERIDKTISNTDFIKQTFTDDAYIKTSIEDKFFDKNVYAFKLSNATVNNRYLAQPSVARLLTESQEGGILAPILYLLDTPSTSGLIRTANSANIQTTVLNALREIPEEILPAQLRIGIIDNVLEQDKLWDLKNVDSFTDNLIDRGAKYVNTTSENDLHKLNFDLGINAPNTTNNVKKLHWMINNDDNFKTLYKDSIDDAKYNVIFSTAPGVGGLREVSFCAPDKTITTFKRTDLAPLVSDTVAHTRFGMSIQKYNEYVNAKRFKVRNGANIVVCDNEETFANSVATYMRELQQHGHDQGDKSLRLIGYNNSQQFLGETRELDTLLARNKAKTYVVPEHGYRADVYTTTAVDLAQASIVKNGGIAVADKAYDAVRKVMRQAQRRLEEYIARYDTGVDAISYASSRATLAVHIDANTVVQLEAARDAILDYIKHTDIVSSLDEVQVKRLFNSAINEINDTADKINKENEELASIFVSTSSIQNKNVMALLRSNYTGEGLMDIGVEKIYDDTAVNHWFPNAREHINSELKNNSAIYSSRIQAAKDAFEKDIKSFSNKKVTRMSKQDVDTYIRYVTDKQGSVDAYMQRILNDEYDAAITEAEHILDAYKGMPKEQYAAELLNTNKNLSDIDYDKCVRISGHDLNGVYAELDDQIADLNKAIHNYEVPPEEYNLKLKEKNTETITQVRQRLAYYENASLKDYTIGRLQEVYADEPDCLLKTVIFQHYDPDHMAEVETKIAANKKAYEEATNAVTQYKQLHPDCTYKDTTYAKLRRTQLKLEKDNAALLKERSTEKELLKTLREEQLRADELYAIGHYYPPEIATPFELEELKELLIKERAEKLERQHVIHTTIKKDNQWIAQQKWYHTIKLQEDLDALKRTKAEDYALLQKHFDENKTEFLQSLTATSTSEKLINAATKQYAKYQLAYRVEMLRYSRSANTLEHIKSSITDLDLAKELSANFTAETSKNYIKAILSNLYDYVRANGKTTASRSEFIEQAARRLNIDYLSVINPTSKIDTLAIMLRTDNLVKQNLKKMYARFSSNATDTTISEAIYHGSSTQDCIQSVLNKACEDIGINTLNGHNTLESIVDYTHKYNPESRYLASKYMEDTSKAEIIKNLDREVDATIANVEQVSNKIMQRRLQQESQGWITAETEVQLKVNRIYSSMLDSFRSRIAKAKDDYFGELNKNIPNNLREATRAEARRVYDEAISKITRQLDNMKYDFAVNRFKTVLSLSPENYAAYLHKYALGRQVIQLDSTLVRSGKDEIQDLLGKFKSTLEEAKAYGVHSSYNSETKRIFIWLDVAAIESDAFRKFSKDFVLPKNKRVISKETTKFLNCMDDATENAYTISNHTRFSEYNFDEVTEFFKKNGIDTEAVGVSKAYYVDRGMLTRAYNHTFIGDYGEGLGDCFKNMSKNPLTNFASGYNGTQEFLACKENMRNLLFNKQNTANGMFSHYSVQAALKAIKDNHLVACTLSNNGEVIPVSVMGKKSLQKLIADEDSRTVFLTYQIYNTAVEHINNNVINSKLYRMLNHYILAPIKIGQLATLGWTARNIVDSFSKGMFQSKDALYFTTSLATTRKNLQLYDRTLSMLYKETKGFLSREAKVNFFVNHAGDKTILDEQLFDHLDAFMHTSSATPTAVQLNLQQSIMNTFEQYVADIDFKALGLNKKDELEKVISYFQKNIDRPTLDVVKEVKDMYTGATEEIGQTIANLRYQMPQQLQSCFISRMPIVKQIMDVNAGVETLMRTHVYLYNTVYTAGFSDVAHKLVDASQFNTSRNGKLITLLDQAFPFISFAINNLFFFISNMDSSTTLLKCMEQIVPQPFMTVDADEYANNLSLQYAMLNGNIPIGDTYLKLNSSINNTIQMLADPIGSIADMLHTSVDSTGVAIKIIDKCWSEGKSLTEYFDEVDKLEQDYYESGLKGNYSEYVNKNEALQAVLNLIPLVGVAYQRLTSNFGKLECADTVLPFLFSDKSLFVQGKGWANDSVDSWLTALPVTNSLFGKVKPTKPTGYDWFNQTSEYRRTHRYVYGVSYIPSFIANNPATYVDTWDRLQRMGYTKEQATTMIQQGWTFRYDDPQQLYNWTDSWRYLYKTPNGYIKGLNEKTAQMYRDAGLTVIDNVERAPYWLLKDSDIYNNTLRYYMKQGLSPEEARLRMLQGWYIANINGEEVAINRDEQNDKDAEAYEQLLLFQQGKAPFPANYVTKADRINVQGDGETYGEKIYRMYGYKYLKNMWLNPDSGEVYFKGAQAEYYNNKYGTPRVRTIYPKTYKKFYINRFSPIKYKGNIIKPRKTYYNSYRVNRDIYQDLFYNNNARANSTRVRTRQAVSTSTSTKYDALHLSMKYTNNNNRSAVFRALRNKRRY